jgi:hypothetical protein
MESVGNSLGEHCALATCRQLDFLPFQCDGCNETFCAEHFKYAARIGGIFASRRAPCASAVGFGGAFRVRSRVAARAADRVLTGYSRDAHGDSIGTHGVLTGYSWSRRRVRRRPDHHCTVPQARATNRKPTRLTPTATSYALTLTAL